MEKHFIEFGYEEEARNVAFGGGGGRGLEIGMVFCFFKGRALVCLGSLYYLKIGSSRKGVH